MKKIYTLVILLSIIFSANAKDWVGTKSLTAQPAKVELISSDVQTTILKATVTGFYKSAVNTGRESAFTLSLDGAYNILQKGAPDLLKLSASVIVPDMSKMKVEIISSEYSDIENIYIAPSKGSLYRNINPSEVPFVYGDVYGKNNFFPGNLASLQSPYIMRDYRGQAVWIYPFQYNPVTKVLRVYSEIVLKISEDIGTGANPFIRTKAATRIDAEFKDIYSHHFLNPPQFKYNAVDETGGMLIIAYGSYMSAMQPLVDWKIRRGLAVDMVSVTTAGGTATAIQSYIVNYYNTHNLKYVLLVGDAAQVPTLTASGGASDPSYGFIVGNDSYPEVFVGRFSAESLADVNTQVQRVIDYERFPQAGAAWYNHGIGVASNLGPGDDNEYDWEHERNIRTKLLAFTYTGVDELYDGTHAVVDAAGDPANTDLISSIQSGASIVNYTGHGSQTAFVTTSFSVNDIPSLTNYHMLPFICSVGCVNGDFTTGTCLAETFLRAQVSNQPTGAIATFMSSINQYWNEPMRAQDEMIDLLVGTYATNIKRTYGGLCENGCMNMNDVYTTTGYDMTNTWHIFGDPSLCVRTATPTPITASHAATIPVGSTQLSISCNTDGAFASLVLNGAIIGTGTVASGNVVVNFPSVTIIDTIYVTITGFNKIPYEGIVQTVPISGPYVIHASSTIVDVTGNNNSLPDYGENISLNVTLQNVGLAAANGVNATISTTTPGITITNASNTFGNINSSASSSVNNAFAYSIANNIADQLVVPFSLTITDNASNTWNAYINHTMNAPALAIGTMTINDATGGNGNGVLEPGESAVITIVNWNNGHSASPAATAVLSSTNPNINISNPNINLGVLNASASANAAFNVSMAPSMQFGSVFPLTITTTAGGYSTTNTYMLTAGDHIEDFESGTFNTYPWIMAGDLPWTISTTNSFQGTYNARANANLADNQTSEMNITIHVLSDDSISFYCFLITEQNHDFLRLYIDATPVISLSGTIAWSYYSYPITSGVHLLRWVYEKDAATTVTNERARVDNINFPPFDLVTSVAPVVSHNNSLTVYPNPASNQSTILFSLEKSSNVSLKVYNTLGEEVSSLFDNARLNEGVHSAAINSRKLEKGSYLIRLIENGKAVTKKFVVE